MYTNPGYFSSLADVFIVFPGEKKRTKAAYVPLRALDIALSQCHRHLRFLSHDDIDDVAQVTDTLGLGTVKYVTLLW